jgi:hypothetical protein
VTCKVRAVNSAGHSDDASTAGRTPCDSKLSAFIKTTPALLMRLCGVAVTIKLLPPLFCPDPDQPYISVKSSTEEINGRERVRLSIQYQVYYPAIL